MLLSEKTSVHQLRSRRKLERKLVGEKSVISKQTRKVNQQGRPDLERVGIKAAVNMVLCIFI